MSEVELNKGRLKILEHECQTIELGVKRRMEEIRKILDPLAEDVAEVAVEKAVEKMGDLSNRVIALREKRERIAALKKALDLV
jgi:hypothetical protein